MSENEFVARLEVEEVNWVRIRCSNRLVLSQLEGLCGRGDRKPAGGLLVIQHCRQNSYEPTDGYLGSGLTPVAPKRPVKTTDGNTNLR